MRPALTSLFALTVVLAAPSSFAQEAGPAPQVASPEAPLEPLPAPAPTQAAPTTNVQTAPGSGGLTVVAPLAGGGSMTAVGCSAVTVSGHSTDVRAGGAGQPCAAAPPVEFRPRYARDGGRKAAIITAPIVYGIGAAVAGSSYLGHKNSCYGYSSSKGCNDGSTSLWAYGIISAGVPSIPRWVVGDPVRALIYTGARGASIATAAVVDWGHSDDAWMGPFVLGFAAPLTLAIVDMATTPHREDLEDAPDDNHAAPEPRRADGARLTGVAPVALGDREHKGKGGGVAFTGTF